jgi:hypothetical protein
LKVNLTSHQRHLELFLRQNNLQVSVPFYTLEDNIIVQRTNKNIKVSNVLYMYLSWVNQ